MRFGSAGVSLHPPTFSCIITTCLVALLVVEHAAPKHQEKRRSEAETKKIHKHNRAEDKSDSHYLKCCNLVLFNAPKECLENDQEI